MFWNRKPKEVIERKPSPCGNDETHYEWEDAGFCCPACMGIRNRKAEDERKEREMDMLAEKIATKLAEKLRVPTAVSTNAVDDDTIG